MNKTELVAEISKRVVNHSKNEISDILKVIFDIIAETMASGQEVKIPDFGQFIVSHRAACQGRNPRTGDKIDIKAQNIPKFRPSKALKSLLNPDGDVDDSI